MRVSQPLHVSQPMLQAAWQRRRGADWPDTFHACMAHPLYRAIVRAEAIRAALAQRNAARHRLGSAAAHGTTATRPGHASHTRVLPGFDRKCAAAGDTPEPDDPAAD